MKARGFTIVELLIVIVVIGILAAITVVAYNGIQNRARVSAASSALTQAAKKITIAMNDGTLSSFPSSQAEFDSLGLPTTASYQYSQTTINGNPGYCITATVGTTSYKITNASSPEPMGCAGHGTGGVGAVTNLVGNPSLESNTSGWGAFSATTNMIRETGTGSIGSYRLKLTRSVTGGDAYASHTTSQAPPLSTPYTLSFYIWADSPVNLSAAILFRHLTTSGNYHTLATGSSNYPVTNTPTRVVLSGVTNSAASGQGLQIILRLPAAADVPVYYDGFMITQGTDTPNYADGNSKDWVWNGTVNNSTSTGPPVN